MSTLSSTTRTSGRASSGSRSDSTTWVIGRGGGGLRVVGVWVEIYVYWQCDYGDRMPNKTIYVSDADLPVFQRAQELTGGNLSAAISKAALGMSPIISLPATGTPCRSAASRTASKTA